MTVDVAKLRALLESVGPNPWRPYACREASEQEACGIKNEPFVSASEDAYQRGVVHDTNRDECQHMMARSHATLICAAANALPELLDVAEAALAYVRALHQERGTEGGIAVARRHDLLVVVDAALRQP